MSEPPIVTYEDSICTTWYRCPLCECNTIQIDYKFCPICGSELAWPTECNWTRAKHHAWEEVWWHASCGKGTYGDTVIYPASVYPEPPDTCPWCEQPVATYERPEE